MSPVLRDDALEPQPASVLEDRADVPDDVLVELDARVGDLTQEVLEPTPATGVELHEWASRIEESVFDVLDDLGTDRKPQP